MNTHKRIDEYIESISYINDDLLEEIRQESLDDNVPIIRRSTENLIKSLLSMNDIKNILEVGSATGYSSIVMAKHTNAHITTIENYPKRIKKAKENIKKSDLANRITLLEGDATYILKDLVDKQKKYDFIFMDAAKSQYINWLEMIKKLLNKKAVLVSDNILQENTLIDSRYSIDRRDRTIHSKLRKYLYTLMNDDDLQSSIVYLGDGVAISVLV